ncbi:sulfurtransferase TusA family protein [Pseudomonas sp. N040]|uniref:sulfurtransferase TusA family protein n=1 Tax=Pseudomonas sp. N040 TaxID=2785325 RepID=UPI0018A27C7F|nr:sulfurtransferase TusA family protein [Pseudomonas sp. N040]MBF7729347.1 sulfurtransferase TusA family protein [Pseudomonas sp. N040]MBW7012987.1 sulfurtransferase TusA family protein [Pseudomonas sp. N040]
MTDPAWPEYPCDAEVDARGLSCPMPLLKAKLELNRLPSGATLKVLATDAGSQRDFRAFARLAGHTLLREEVAAGVYGYWLCKA